MTDERIELLAAAFAIADRQGRETNWTRFRDSLLKCLAAHGRNGVTPRTYRLLPTDTDAGPARPPVVCLCGSTRFAERFNAEAERLTIEGFIVVRPEVVAYSSERDPQRCAPDVKERLDELHKRKIDIADQVLVLNVGGYIGSSTRSEIEYAQRTGKPIAYLEPAATADHGAAP